MYMYKQYGLDTFVSLKMSTLELLTTQKYIFFYYPSRCRHPARAEAVVCHAETLVRSGARCHQVRSGD